MSSFNIRVIQPYMFEPAMDSQEEEEELFVQGLSKLMQTDKFVFWDIKHIPARCRGWFLRCLM